MILIFLVFILGIVRLINTKICLSKVVCKRVNILHLWLHRLKLLVICEGKNVCIGFENVSIQWKQN